MLVSKLKEEYEFIYYPIMVRTNKVGGLSSSSKFWENRIIIKQFSVVFAMLSAKNDGKR